MKKQRSFRRGAYTYMTVVLAKPLKHASSNLRVYLPKHKAKLRQIPVAKQSADKRYFLQILL